MLGLPEDMPAGVSAGDKRGEGGDTGLAIRQSCIEPGRRVAASPEDLLEIAGRAFAIRQCRGQAARADDAGRQACRRTRIDRGHALR